MEKPDTKQSKKEENFRLRSLGPVLLFCTGVVILVSVIGRIASSK